MPAIPSACTTLAIRKTIDQPFFDPTGTGVEKALSLEEWKVGQKYRRDEQVLTKSTSTTSPTFYQWCHRIVIGESMLAADGRREDERTSIAGDVATAATLNTPALLDTDFWIRVELGEIYSLDSIELSRDATETRYRFMREKRARLEYEPNPMSITANLFSMADRQAIERIFARIGQPAYIEIKEAPNVIGTKGIRIRGYARLASSTKSYPSNAGNITKSLVFQSTGDDFVEEVWDVVAPAPQDD